MGTLKGCDVAALGVDAGEDVTDGAVFTGSVHALKNDEQGFLLAGVKDVLKVGKLLPVFDQNGCGCLLRLVTVGVGGRFLREPYVGGAA